MSPEQVHGEKLDTRTDLFSFGLVLYEMATGQRAFRGETEAILHDAILTAEPRPLRELAPEVSPGLAAMIDKCLEKDRERRYQSSAELRADLGVLTSRTHRGLIPRHWKLSVSAAIVLTAVVCGLLYWHSRRAIHLSEKDTIVLADFTNRTSDPVFDDALNTVLRIELEQTPFLNLLATDKVRGALKQMNRSENENLTPGVAREVCLHTNSTAYLTGLIADEGNDYGIELKAMDCRTGKTFARTELKAENRNQVVEVLGLAGNQLRRGLGEPLSSVQKYSTPAEEAATPSLEALKAYTLGLKTNLAKGFTPSLPLYERAVELDPNFAMPYAVMAGVYGSLNEMGRAAENARMAYERRERASQRERLSIELSYHLYATGELDKAARVAEVWQQIYPRDRLSYMALGYISNALGDYAKALRWEREALRLEPNNEVNYLNLGFSYAALNRLDEAEAVYKQAEELKLEGEALLAARYQLAFLQGNTAKMTLLAAAAVGTPGTEDSLLASQADTAAWYGKLKDAQNLTRRAMDSAQHNDAKESAATYQASAALREVESGNRKQARAHAHAAVKLAPNRDVQAMAALALARAGDTVGAEKAAAELDETFTLDTLVQTYWLPAIRAAVALERKDPNRAIELLKVASPIELGVAVLAANSGYLVPVYLRGEAYLMLDDGNAARAQFQKFLDHHGVVGNFQWGALAHLQLARAQVMMGDKAAARKSYQDFLTLWKDADPDIPIYQQAKAEYAKLK